jgi:DNA-binding CsgD family transcriptional regulator
MVAGVGLAQRGLAELAVAQEDWSAARAGYEECLRGFRKMGDLAGVNTVQQDLADLALASGARQEAEDLLYASVCVDSRLGDDWSIARQGLGSGFFVWVAGLARAHLPGPPGDGATFLMEVLRVQQRWQGEHGLLNCFRELANAALERHDDQQAARLLGAADALDRQARRPPRDCDALAWEEGHAMSPERALAAALAHAPVVWGPAPDRERPASTPGGLTARELEVLRLVSGGLTNHEIAGQLVLSERTIGTHLDHIFAKLHVSSRASATAFAIRSGIA